MRTAGVDRPGRARRRDDWTLGSGHAAQCSCIRNDTATPTTSGVPTDLAITFDDVRRAAVTLQGVAHRTPVITSAALDGRVGATVLLKAENLQRVGAFKFRGAYNAVASLDDATRARGVVTASSGNHAQALALAARLHGIPATILMPQDAPASKRVATEGYGAEVIAFNRYSR